MIMKNETKNYQKVEREELNEKLNWMIKWNPYGIKLNLKKNKNKKINKIKQLENDLFKAKCSRNPNKLLTELKGLSKIQVIGKNLRQIKNEILRD